MLVSPAVAMVLALLPVGLSAMAEAGVVGGPRPASATLAADLPGRALSLAHTARPGQAHELLTTELLGALSSGAWADERSIAEAEVAARLLNELTAKLDLWRETAELLASAAPWPDSTPPQLAFLLDHLQARCWTNVGKTNRARGIINGLGYITDWYLAGPFDNERGGGFETAFEPEQRFDTGATMEGKERDVRWRLNPGRQHPMARVRLDQVLRPRKQSVAYLATAVQADRDRPVVLRLGTETSFKVFHNGNEVASRRVERPFAIDQDRIVLRLSEGWNQLLVKLAIEEGSWAFEARFTDLDGRPLIDMECQSAFTAWPGPAPHEDFIRWWELEGAGWSVEQLGALPGEQVVPAGEHDGHDHVGVEAADAAESIPDWPTPPPPPDDWTWPRPVPDGPAPAPSRGAADILADHDDVVALRQLATWHLLVHPDDVVDRTARRHAERAVELAPADALSHFLLALASGAEGASTNELEVNRRLHALERVIQIDPTHVLALLALAEFATIDNPTPRHADELLQRAVAAAPGSWDALTARARFLHKRQRVSEADALQRRAEQSGEGATRTDGLLARASRLQSLGLTDAAVELLLEGYARDSSSRRLADRLIDDLVEAGRTELALVITERCLQVEPFDLRRLLRSAARFEHAGGNFSHRARELVTRALDVCPENTDALADLVRLDVGLGRTDLASRVLVEIVRLDPGDDHARRHLALLTMEAEERFEDPYRQDAARLLGFPDGEDGNEPFEVLDRTVVWRVYPDGTEHTYEHVVLRVLSQAGVKRLDTWNISGAGDARVKVYGVRVLHPDGSVEHAPAPRWRRGGSRSYDLPPLSPGDLVDIEHRIDQRSADVFGEYFGLRHEFYLDRVDTLAPTRRSELVVIAPEEVPLHVSARNVENLEASVEIDAAGRRIYRWVARDLQRPEVQGRMPARAEFAPVVDVTTFPDWDAFAGWWWDFIEKEFVTTEAMREKVAELVAGRTTERERIEAIARFVGQEIRYNAWAFGTHGYEPYSAATIFERRFGDCKDKSILLRQMLAEIDVEAIPVLIKAEYFRADEPLQSAMVGLFNHCIAYLPATDEREGQYLDATADLNPIDYLRADDQGARVLHVDEAGGTLHDIPYAPAAENTLLRSYDVTLSPGGAARVELVDESTGLYGVRLRTRYGGEQGDIERNLSKELASSFGTIEIIDVVTSDLEDIGEAARLATSFEAGELWSRDGDQRGLSITLDPLGLESLAQERPEDRSFELVLDRPFRSRSEVLYHLPEGSRVLELPMPAEIELPGLLSYSLSTEQLLDGIRVVRDFSLHVRRVGLPDYAAFRNALRDIDQIETRVVRVTPGNVD